MPRTRTIRIPPAIWMFLFIGLAVLTFWLVHRHFNRPLAPTITADARPIRIATWNLRTFSDRARPDLVTIAKIIKEGEFDLVAIQEVQRQGQMVERLRRQLNEPWRHVVSPLAGNGEHFAFLYRSDILEPVGEPRLLSSPDAPIFARTPYIGTFRAKQFDFTLITVHLSYTDRDRRQREAQALARIVPALAGASAEKDIIILGDFNEQRRGNLHYLEAVGWTKLITEPTNLGSTEIYDQLIINPRHTREWLNRTGVLRFDETRYNNDDNTARDDISDHRPAWADFATAGPDDD